jgi:hypothetical protein
MKAGCVGIPVHLTHVETTWESLDCAVLQSFLTSIGMAARIVPGQPAHDGKP